MTVTLQEMTRFLLTIDQAVDTVFAALQSARPGETYVRRAPSARVVDLAKVLIGERDIPVVYTGIRAGEKIHEIMVSEEEAFRTIERDGYYVIRPLLAELQDAQVEKSALTGEYSSADSVVDEDELRALLREHLQLSPVADTL